MKDVFHWGKLGDKCGHTYVCQPPAQVILPALVWGHLWDEHPVRTTRQSRHQCKVPAARHTHTLHVYQLFLCIIDVEMYSTWL